MDPSKLLKLNNAKNTFVNNHPKFPMFLKAVRKDALKEGTIIEIKVTTPEGNEINSNLKIRESDIDALRDIL